MEGNSRGSKESELLLQAVLQLSEDMARLEKRMSQENRKLYEEIKKQKEDFGKIVPQQERQAQELNRLMDGTTRREVELSNLREHIQKGYHGLYTMWNQKVSQAERESQALMRVKEELSEYVSRLREVKREWALILAASVVVSSVISTWMVGYEMGASKKLQQMELERLWKSHQEAVRMKSWCENLSDAESERAQSFLRGQVETSEGSAPSESKGDKETRKKSEKKSSSEKRKQ